MHNLNIKYLHLELLIKQDALGAYIWTSIY